MDNKNSTFKNSSGLVLFIDVLISSVVSGIAILFVRWIIHPVPGFALYVLGWMAIAAVASLVSFLIVGTHKIVIRYSSFKSIGSFAAAVLIKEVIMSLAILANLFVFAEGEADIMLVVFDALLTLISMILFRVVFIAIGDRLRDNIEVNVGRLVVMVYGVSDKSVAMVTRLEQSNHYMVAGFLTRDKASAGHIVQDHKVYYFATAEDISNLKINIGFASVLFAKDDDALAEQDGLVKMCLQNGIHLLVTPKVEEASFAGMTQAAVKQVVDNDFIPDGMSSFERNTKRLIDFGLSAVLLVVFSPLFLICYIALKVGDKGPAIYKQERIGRFGRPFNIYKFRSMRTDAESDGPALYSGDDDPRLTKVGGFLRRHHLDELPQLWNVFKGDMAFVGYRPERKFFIDKIMEEDPRYYYLYQIRPGVTSYATLRNGYTDSMEKMLRRLEFDLYYLRHRSLWFDIKVLWQTFANIAFGKVF